MKQCASCDRRIRRQKPENGEYGIPAVDGRQYPDRCPNCETRISEN